MTNLSEQFQTADWKQEKHVPVIECPDTVPADQFFSITVSIGKEIAHPNTSGHHIRWIALYFKAEDEKFTHQIGMFYFDAHGESVEGPDLGSVMTDHAVTVRAKIKKAGTLMASSLCNIHGLWQSSKRIAIV